MSEHNENEVLNSKVSIDQEGGRAGPGEAKVIQDVMSDDFLNASDVDALAIARGLQILIRGQENIDEQQRLLGERMQKVEAEAVPATDDDEARTHAGARY